MTMSGASKKTTIASRLIAFSVIYATSAVILASLVLWLIISGVVREQVDQRLDLQIDAVRNAIRISPAGSLFLDGSIDSPPFDRQGSGWYWEAKAGGQRLTSRSLGNAPIEQPPRPFEWRRLLSAASQPSDGVGVGGQSLHMRLSAAFVSGVSVQIFVSAPSSALNIPATKALLLMLPAMLALGTCLVIGSILQVRFGLQPLRKLSDEILEISNSQRISLDPAQAGELVSVVEEINRLVEANRVRLAQTRLQFANLAHALKTPVASLTLALDAQNDPSGELKDTVARIDRTIRHHLSRAKANLADAGVGHATPVKPRVDDILQMMAKIYAERQITSDNRIPEGTLVICSAEDTDEILAGVIDNAFKWANSSVSITAWKDGPNVRFVVRDDGSGIDVGRFSDAVSPGVRLDESVAGDGFGLSIVKELSELYGGSMALSSAPGEGLTVTIVLPIAIRSYGR